MADGEGTRLPLPWWLSPESTQIRSISLDSLTPARRRRPPEGDGFRASRDAVSSPPMPVSLTSSRLVYDCLREAGVRIMSALPETWLVHLIRMAEDDPAMTLVRLA